MIFTIGVAGVLVCLFMLVWLGAIGKYHIHTYRGTDWLVVVPFWGGVACVLWSLGALAVKWLP